MTRSRIWLRAVKAAAFILAAASTAYAAPSETSICGIIAKPDQYEGREVTIRGSLLVGPFSDFVIVSDECSAGFEVEFTREALGAKPESVDIDGLLRFLEEPSSVAYDVEATLTGQIAIARNRPIRNVTLYVERIDRIQTYRLERPRGGIEPR